MRVGIVGLGWAARASQDPALAAIDGVQLVGGPTCPRDQSHMGRGDLIRSFESLEELIEKTAPDVVIIATPPDSHAALCEQALAREPMSSARSRSWRRWSRPTA